MTARPTRRGTAPRPRGAPSGDPAEVDPSLAYLFGRLAIVEARVRAAVDRRRADDPDPGDRFRGLYISDAQVDGLLAGRRRRPRRGGVDRGGGRRARRPRRAAADAAEAAGADIRLRRLARAFELEPTTSSSCWSRSRRTSTRASSGCTATSTTTSRAGARAPASRWSWPAPAPASRAAPSAVRLGPHGHAGRRAGWCSSRTPSGRSSPGRCASPTGSPRTSSGDDQPDAGDRGPADRVRAGADRRRRRCSRARSTAGIPLVYVRERPGASGRSLAAAALARARPAGPPARPGAHRRRTTTRATSPRRVARGRAARRRASSSARSRRSSERGAARRAGVRRVPRARCVLIGSRPWDPAWAREAAARSLEAPVPTIAAAPRAVARRRSTATRPGGLRPRRRHARVPARAGPDRPRGAGGAPRRRSPARGR